MRDPSAGILHGALGVQLLLFGLPLAVGMGLQTSFNLVDAYLIGKLDSETAGPALGAIGICDQLAALGTIVSYGFSVGTAAIISRKQGAGDSEGMRRVAWQSLLLVCGLSLAFSVLGLVGAPFLIVDVVGAKGRVATLGTEYLRVLIGGSGSIFLLLHLTTLQRALGSSKAPIALLLVANALNLFLAVLLVYGPGPAPAPFAWGPPLARYLGIPRLELLGAAWATVLARASVLLPLLVLSRQRFKLFRGKAIERPHAAILGSIVRVGWPSSAQLVIRIAAMLIIHSLVARSYTSDTNQDATTALGIVFRLETMALFVGLGWGSAAQTFVGQNLGIQNQARAKLSGWIAANYNALMMAALAAAYIAYGRSLIGFFDDTRSVVTLGLGYLKWVAPSYVALGISIVLGAAMQGAGATQQTLKLDLWVVTLVQIPACSLAAFAGSGGPRDLWAVVALTYWVMAGVYVLSYRGGKFLSTVIKAA